MLNTCVPCPTSSRIALDDLKPLLSLRPNFRMRCNVRLTFQRTVNQPILRHEGCGQMDQPYRTIGIHDRASTIYARCRSTIVVRDGLDYRQQHMRPGQNNPTTYSATKHSTETTEHLNMTINASIIKSKRETIER